MSWEVKYNVFIYSVSFSTSLHIIELYPGTITWLTNPTSSAENLNIALHTKKMVNHLGAYYWWTFLIFNCVSSSLEDFPKLLTHSLRTNLNILNQTCTVFVRQYESIYTQEIHHFPSSHNPKVLQSWRNESAGDETTFLPIKFTQCTISLIIGTSQINESILTEQINDLNYPYRPSSTSFLLIFLTILNSSVPLHSYDNQFISDIFFSLQKFPCSTYFYVSTTNVPMWVWQIVIFL